MGAVAYIYLNMAGLKLQELLVARGEAVAGNNAASFLLYKNMSIIYLIILGIEQRGTYLPETLCLFVERRVWFDPDFLNGFGTGSFITRIRLHLTGPFYP